MTTRDPFDPPPPACPKCGWTAHPDEGLHRATCPAPPSRADDGRDEVRAWAVVGPFGYMVVANETQARSDAAHWNDPDPTNPLRVVPLVAARAPMTDEEVDAIFAEAMAPNVVDYFRGIVRAVEQFHGITTREDGNGE